jgi:hypothetical protein
MWRCSLLKKTYQQRIELLYEVASENSNAGGVCSKIAELANSGQLGKFISDKGTNIPFKERKLNFRFYSEGTAHTASWEVTQSSGPALKADEIPSLPPGADDESNPMIGEMLGLLTYKNAYYIIYYRDVAHPLSTIALADSSTCGFSFTVDEKIGQNASQPELCRMLQSDQGITEIPFDTPSKIKPGTIAHEWDGLTIKGTRNIRFANNNVPVNVAQIELISGAGAGCEEIYYDTLNADGTGFDNTTQRDLLMKLQGADPTNRYPVVPCENKPRFISYNNQIFFETKPAGWPPSDSFNAYHRVTTVSHGQVQDVCNFTLKTVVSGYKN